MDSLNYTASQILSKHLYFDLFVSDATESKKLFRMLLRKWHPDMNKNEDTSQVFIHINKIYGMSNLSPQDKFVEIEKGIKKPYSYSVETSLYDIYYSHSDVYFKFKQKSTDLKLNYIKNLKTLKNSLEHHQFKDRYSDTLESTLYQAGDFLKVHLKNFVPLNLLLKYIVEYKDWKISAYIVSRLYDMALMFDNAGLSYIGTDPNFIFVDTKTHKIIDLSALLLSVENGSKMIALTSHQGGAFTKSDINNKTCSNVSINNLIRSTGLMLAGDLNKIGNLNMLDESSNKKMVASLLSTSSNSSVSANYKKWQVEIIPNIFVERSFYKKEIHFSDLLAYADN